MGQYLTQIEQVLDQQSMTQKDLANKIGTSASYISQFFNFNKLINFKTLAKIELALDINFELKQRVFIFYAAYNSSLLTGNSSLLMENFSAT
jgi:transcriptional regulator with XRE-family HTH domain